jgi:hypothetical protein
LRLFCATRKYGEKFGSCGGLWVSLQNIGDSPKGQIFPDESGKAKPPHSKTLAFLMSGEKRAQSCHSPTSTRALEILPDRSGKATWRSHTTSLQNIGLFDERRKTGSKLPLTDERSNARDLTKATIGVAKPHHLTPKHDSTILAF